MEHPLDETTLIGPYSPGQNDDQISRHAHVK